VIKSVDAIDGVVDGGAVTPGMVVETPLLVQVTPETEVVSL
jgi:hypothetical protein